MFLPCSFIGHILYHSLIVFSFGRQGRDHSSRVTSLYTFHLVEPSPRPVFFHLYHSTTCLNLSPSLVSLLTPHFQYFLPYSDFSETLLFFLLKGTFCRKRFVFSFQVFNVIHIKHTRYLKLKPLYEREEMVFFILGLGGPHLV